MKTTIYKYQLELKQMQQVLIPANSEILSAQIQKDEICLWAMVKTDLPNVSRFIEIFGTGQDIPVDMGIDRLFIGTVQQQGFVLHIFERL